MSTTAKIAALGNCKDTGVTPTHATKMWGKLGSRHMALVELAVDERSEDVGDAKGVKLVINSIELADNDDTAEHVRELQRAIYTSRQADKTLTAGVETTPRDVVLRGKVEVLHCEKCVHSLGAENINHGRRSGIQCIWVPCRHTVTAGDASSCGCGMTT